MRCARCWLPASKEGLCKVCYKKEVDLRFQDVIQIIYREEDIDPSVWLSLSDHQQTALLIFSYAYGYAARHHFPRGCPIWPSFLVRVKEHTAGDLCCRGFRAILRSGLYRERVFPEGCAGCALALYLSNTEVYLYPMITAYIYRSCAYETLFKTNGRNRDEVLSFVHELLWIPKDTLFFDAAEADEKRKEILRALRVHGDYLLEELALRPENYPFLLANPPALPECYLDLIFEDPEEIWAFCQRVREKFVKRVEIRCRLFKEELLEKTWNPSRVIPWCCSVDEKESVGAFSP